MQYQANSRKKRRRSSSNKHESVLKRVFYRLPGWAFWLGGLLIIALYAIFFVYYFSPYGLRWRAIHGGSPTPEGYEIHGIDISHHQGTINWGVLRDQGVIGQWPVRFVMIKATEGASRLDPMFSHNYIQAGIHGFIRGAYHYYSVLSSARQQAAFFIKNVRLSEGDLPPVLDVERKPKDQSNEEFKNSVLEWLSIVEKHYGVKPIIYTYYKFKKTYLSDAVFDDYPYWIAHYYVERVEYEGRWKFWQHTDVGRLPGIKGYVDCNVYNGSYYDLRQLTIGSQEPIGVEAYREEN